MTNKLARKDTVLTIGQLAKMSGIGIEAIRFYEKKGLIPKAPRRTSGYRQFSKETVNRILFIRHAKELGFSLKEIMELLSLRVDPVSTCSDVKKRAETKLAVVDEKMRDLRRIKKALTKLVKTCRGKGPTTECPILEALDSGAN